MVAISSRTVPQPALRRRARRRGGVLAAVLLLAGIAGACGGDDGDAATATTAGPVAPEEETYTPPVIEEAARAELCDAARQVGTASDDLSELLVPLLMAEASEQADEDLIAGLASTGPIIAEARAGYDRMAAILPGELSADAGAVRDITVAFYDAVVATSTMDELRDAIDAERDGEREARRSSARLEATVRANCDLSLYGS